MLKLRVAVVADDLGASAGRDAGILLAYRAGVVTTMSILANGPTSNTVVLRKPEYEHVGLHLNLTEGRSLSAPLTVQTLLGTDGNFLGKEGFAQACNRGEICRKEVKHETERQLRWYALRFGRRARTADGHHHCHMQPWVARTIADVWRNSGVESTRMPVGPSPCTTCSAVEWLPVYSGFRQASAFVGFCGVPYTEQEFLDQVEPFVFTVPSLEIMVHPGLFDPQDDTFGQSADRTNETVVLCGMTLPDRLNILNAALVPRNEI